MPGEVRQRRRQAERPVTSHRELVGEYGIKLAELWWSIASDPMRRDSDRLDASRLLAERGKPANFEPQEGDPRGLEDAEIRRLRRPRRRLRRGSSSFAAGTGTTTRPHRCRG
jgi:hypothetical protein